MKLKLDLSRYSPIAIQATGHISHLMKYATHANLACLKRAIVSIDQNVKLSTKFIYVQSVRFLGLFLIVKIPEQPG